MNQSESTIQNVTRVLECEAAAIRDAANRVGPEAGIAVDLLESCRGRLVLTGMGKAGAIARKAAATFCSTGSPAVFLHPAEAVHGDLGIIGEGDVVIALSNSGETEELLSWLPFLRRQGTSLIALTGNPNSTLASHSDVVIDTHVNAEADPLELAPTSSTTVMLAMCDALAIALTQRRGFTSEQFAIFHPGGNIGRKLLLKVVDLMRTGDAVPIAAETASCLEAIETISQKQMGCVFIVDQHNQLAGIVTDGDVRRAMVSFFKDQKSHPLESSVNLIMTQSPHSISREMLAAEAMQKMEERQITALPVVDDTKRIIGVLHLHDLIRSGLA
jgi:arabinose-5-phosphate isomerase